MVVNIRIVRTNINILKPFLPLTKADEKNQNIKYFHHCICLHKLNYTVSVPGPDINNSLFPMEIS